MVKCIDIFNDNMPFRHNDTLLFAEEVDGIIVKYYLYDREYGRIGLPKDICSAVYCNETNSIVFSYGRNGNSIMAWDLSKKEKY